MMSPVMIVIYILPIILGTYAYSRGDDSFKKGLTRGLEQFIIIVPRMICALIAAEFLAMLIPAKVISQFLGDESGLVGILIGTLTGMIVPSGPVISFSIAATMYNAGASVPAVIAFLTAWSIFSGHRILIYEIPLLGVSFFRIRFLSVLMLPILAGSFALLSSELASILMNW
jgi:uncharacterized membrane protein YraQ (UPF0718 family)